MKISARLTTANRWKRQPGELIGRPPGPAIRMRTARLTAARTDHPECRPSVRPEPESRTSVFRATVPIEQMRPPAQWLCMIFSGNNRWLRGTGFPACRSAAYWIGNDRLEKPVPRPIGGYVQSGENRALDRDN